MPKQTTIFKQIIDYCNCKQETLHKAHWGWPRRTLIYLYFICMVVCIIAVVPWLVWWTRCATWAPLLEICPCKNKPKAVKPCCQMNRLDLIFSSVKQLFCKSASVKLVTESTGTGTVINKWDGHSHYKYVIWTSVPLIWLVRKSNRDFVSWVDEKNDDERLCSSRSEQSLFQTEMVTRARRTIRMRWTLSESVLTNNSKVFVLLSDSTSSKQLILG